MDALHEERRERDGEGRLSQTLENGKVFADYRRRGEVLVVTHVEAEPQLRNTGAAGRFMEKLVDWAREHDEKLEPRCGYAVAWFARTRRRATF